MNYLWKCIYFLSMKSDKWLSPTLICHHPHCQQFWTPSLLTSPSFSGTLKLLAILPLCPVVITEEIIYYDCLRWSIFELIDAKETKCQFFVSSYVVFLSYVSTHSLPSWNFFCLKCLHIPILSIFWFFSPAASISLIKKKPDYVYNLKWESLFA